MLNNFKWYRKLKGGSWYKCFYTYQVVNGKLNRFTKVIETENYAI